MAIWLLRTHWQLATHLGQHYIARRVAGDRNLNAVSLINNLTFTAPTLGFISWHLAIIETTEQRDSGDTAATNPSNTGPDRGHWPPTMSPSHQTPRLWLLWENFQDGILLDILVISVEPKNRYHVLYCDRKHTI